MKRFLLAGVAAVLLTACSSDNPHHLTSGKIIGKGHEDAYTYVIMERNCVPTGTTGSGQQICTSYPIYEHQDATWTIEIQNCANNTPRQQVSGTCDKGKPYLTPEEWAGLKVGQWYDASGTDDTSPSASAIASS